MNNRNPFIPTSQQGHWSTDTTSTSNLLPGGSNSNQQQFSTNGQFQQVQFSSGSGGSAQPPQYQYQYQSPSLIPECGNVNMNQTMNMNQANYSYQQHQQLQFAVNPHQSQRGLQLALADTQHFVHFPMNLSPTGNVNVVPLSIQNTNTGQGRSSSNNNQFGNPVQFDSIYTSAAGSQGPSLLGNPTYLPMGTVLNLNARGSSDPSPYAQSSQRPPSQYSVGSSSTPSPTPQFQSFQQPQPPLTPSPSPASTIQIQYGGPPGTFQQGIQQPTSVPGSYAGSACAPTPALTPPQLYNSRSPVLQQGPLLPPAHSVSNRTTTTTPTYFPIKTEPLSVPPVVHLSVAVQQQPKPPTPPPPKPRKPRAPRKKKEKAPPPTPLQDIKPIVHTVPSPIMNIQNTINHVFGTPPTTSQLVKPPISITRPQGTLVRPRPQVIHDPGPRPVLSHPQGPLLRPPVPAAVPTQTTPVSQSSFGHSIACSRPSIPMVATTSPQRAPQRRQSQQTPTTGGVTNVTASSPQKPLSVLDYALEKAGIPTDPAFLESVTEAKPSDFDLESELNRFYNPSRGSLPDNIRGNQTQGQSSPQKPVVSVPMQVASSSSSTGTPSSSLSSSTTASATATTTTSSLGPVRPQCHSGQQQQKTALISHPQAQRRGSASSGTRSQKSRKTNKKYDSSDDELEVLMVKLNKKKAAVANNKMMARNKKTVGPLASISLQSKARPNLSISVVKGNNSATTSRAGPACSKPGPQSQKNVGRIGTNNANGKVAVAAVVATRKSPERTAKPITNIKATARKTAEPIKVIKGRPLPAKSKGKPTSNRSRSCKIWSDEDDEDDLFALVPKMTRQRALITQQEGRQKRSAAEACLQSIQGPIKMKVNLKEGTAKNVESPSNKPTMRTRAGPKSKTKINTSASEGTVNEDDDLEIVDEFLADSDASYNPEGERDEASPDSDEDEVPIMTKKKSPTKPLKHRKGEKDALQNKTDDDAKPQNTLKKDKEQEETETKNVPSPEHEMEIPFEPFATEPEFQLDNDDNLSPPTSPPSPPFKNTVVSNEEKKPPDPEIPVVKPPDQLVQVESESEEEEDVQVKFILPKPTIVIRGTKEDADKAVNSMRETLAQLTKFKLPFFGK